MSHRTPPRTIALAHRLATLDDTMRTRDLTPRRAVGTRVRFFLAALKANALGSLNTLGELAPCSRLSERSLDWVFECGAVSDAVVIELVRRCRQDPVLRCLLEDRGYARCLDDWEAFAREPRSAVQCDLIPAA